MPLRRSDADTAAVKRLLLVPLVLATLALAGPASARTVEIRLGDTVDVAGTKLLCVAAESSGIKGIGCYEANAKGFVPGTFGAALGEDGRVSAHKIDAKGQPQRIFRKLASRSGRYLKLTVGDVFYLKGTRVACEIANPQDVPAAYRGVKVGCYIGTATGVKPLTYGIAISDRYAGIFRMSKDGKSSTDVFERRQP